MTRLVVGLVALGVPLVAVPTVQAGIGSSNPVTTNRPDLRSATILPIFNEVELCFDTTSGAIVANAAAGQIQVGGYVPNSISPGGGAVNSQDNCVKNQYGGNTDLQSATYAHVNAGTVKNQVGPLTNLADSRPLIGSVIKSGTRGFTTGPDLQITLINTAQSQMGFQFDQRIDTTTTAADGGAAPASTNANCVNGVGPASAANPIATTSFPYYTQTGSNGIFGNVAGTAFVVACTNDSSGHGNVLVQYAGAAAANLPNARRTTALDDAVRSILPSVAHNRGFSVVAGGGTGTTSDDPDLVGVALSDPTGSNNGLDFTFDENVAGGGLVPGSFLVIRSNGSILAGTAGGASILPDGKTVRVFFPAGSETTTEFWVGGYLLTGAVTAADDGQAAPFNGLPAGGNADATATGWTTGPDPVAATTNPAGNTIDVRFDQRVFSVSGNATLVDSDGNLSVACAPGTALPAGTPGQQTVRYQCPSAPT